MIVLLLICWTALVITCTPVSHAKECFFGGGAWEGYWQLQLRTKTLTQPLRDPKVRTVSVFRVFCVVLINSILDVSFTWVTLGMRRCHDFVTKVLYALSFLSIFGFREFVITPLVDRICPNCDSLVLGNCLFQTLWLRVPAKQLGASTGNKIPSLVGGAQFFLWQKNPSSKNHSFFNDISLISVFLTEKVDLDPRLSLIRNKIHLKRSKQPIFKATNFPDSNGGVFEIFMTENNIQVVLTQRTMLSDHGRCRFRLHRLPSCRNVKRTFKFENLLSLLHGRLGTTFFSKKIGSQMDLK